MKRSLWKPQQLAWPYVMGTRHPAVFMEMRLGKCLLVIRRCKLYKPHDASLGLRILVVAPTSTFQGWVDELKEEGEPDPVLLIGPKKKRRDLLARNDSRWYIINKEGYIALPEIASPRCVWWDAVILDESTFIKNPKARVTKFFTTNFRHVRHRWVLTGTPIPESPMEYFCQLKFLDGEAFGHKNFWSWRAEDWQPTEDGYGWQPKPGVSARIDSYVGHRAVILRRRDIDMEVDRISTKRVLELPKKVRKWYDEIEDEFAVEDRDMETQWAITKYAWMRQLCGGYLEGELVWDGKLKELCSLLRGELRNEQVVVWFNYNNEVRGALELLRRHQVSCKHMWGEHSQEQRMATIKAFQKGLFRVILVQQAVAQEGVNFSNADTAIYYSEPASSKAKLQTMDRCLRLDKKSPLLFINLLVENSVDEDVYLALKTKQFKANKSMSQALRAAMLERKQRA